MENTSFKKNIADNLELDNKRNKGGLMKKIVILLLIIAAVLIGLKFMGGKGSETGTLYETQKVGKGDLTITVSATGSLKPRNQVDVGSEMSGIVKTVMVDVNDHVTKGQTLVTLDTLKMEAQVQQSEASLEAARANILESQATKKLAESDLKRLKEVWEASGHKVPSKSELDSAEASLTRAIASESSAKAQASQAKATLEANRTDLGKMVITSPIDGIVLDRDIEPGQTVAASFQAPVLLTLAEDLTKMELSVDVDEADVGLVKDGQDAIFTVDAYPDQAFTANILHVKYGSDTTEGVVTYETLLSVDNKNLLLRPGMTATAEIIVKRINNELVIPNSALRFEPPDLEKEPEAGGFRFGPPMSQSNSTDRPKEQEGPLKKVWVLKNGKPEPLTITTGHTDGEMTQVTGGIEPGVEVITGIAEK